ncbi:MAG: glycosyltransferase family 39 protein [Endomicrobiaceae bacterium]|nr:glycosyltransferase family 39 protein [Endomicrobiaceae bacterium]MDD3053940.1 glycosyltransferase family 39 protein [Endomicrobiaceae bacterium]MDD3923403.1 glycosyltransferase family 39 protein [Endomicrobiaceae bacterium]
MKIFNINIIKNDKRCNESIIIFIIIAIFYAIGNFIWWKLNTPIIPYNVDSLHFLDVFRSNLLYYNAPLIPYITKILFFLYSKEYFDLIIIFINYIFFLIGLYCIYKISFEISSKKTGNIAMILFALVPAVYGLTRFYGRQDYHVMIIMIINIYCLIKTDYFNDKKWSILYAISIGIGLMTKDVFIAYFFIPYIYIFRNSLKESINSKKILNIFLIVIIACLISCWHYFRYLILLKIFFEPITEVSAGSLFYNIREITFGLSEELLSFPFFILFLVGLIWYIIKYKNKYKFLLLVWLFVPWFIIFLMKHYKDSIFCIGLIPPMILISSIYLSNIKIIFLRRTLIVLFIIIGLFQYIEYSYSIDFGLSKIKLNYKNFHFMYFNKYANISNINKKYVKKIQDLLIIIKKYYPSTIFINYNNNEIPIKFTDFLSYMYLNDIFFSFDTVISWTDLSTVDMIIYIGENLPPTKQLDFYVKDIKEHPMASFDNIDINHFSNEFIEMSNIRENIINEQFYIVDEFFLGNDQDDKYKIKILKKKRIL